MTEYDFSPEGYQRHLANMSRISQWVDRTERHRPEFQDASALLDPSSLPRHGHDDPPHGKLRKRPPPLPLHLPPRPQYPYPSPPLSADLDFTYASGPFSPGPLPYPPPLMSAPLPPPGHMYPQLTFVSPPPTPSHHRHHHSHHSHGRSSRRSSRSRSSSISFPPATSIGMGYYPYTGIHPGAAQPPPAYAPGPSVLLPPGYVALPPPHSLHGSKHNRNRFSYMYM